MPGPKRRINRGAMKIIIVGCGRVGFLLTRKLVEQGHDLIVIDNNEEAYRQVKESLDVMAILGDGGSPIVLEQATESKIDLVIAVTSSDNVNTVSCLIAKQYGVPRCIVRINNPDHLVNPLLMDEKEIRLIYPQQIIANELTRLVSNYNVTSLNTFAQGSVEILKFKINKDSPVVGKSLNKIALPPSWIFISIIRNKEVIIPHGDTVAAPADSIVAIGTTKTRGNIEKFMNTSLSQVSRVVILGGSQIGLYLSRRLVKQGVSVRIIEKDPKKAEALANELPEALVLQGDGTNDDLLKEAGVNNSDYFISLTRDDEVNILGSLLANDMGCRKVAVISRKPQYNNVIKRVGIGEVVSPLMITVNEILQFVGKGNIFSTAIIEDGKARLVQLMAGKNSQVVKQPLKKIKFPSGSLVGLIIREENVIIPKGSEQIRANDKVILVTTPGNIKKIESLFR